VGVFKGVRCLCNKQKSWLLVRALSICPPIQRHAALRRRRCVIYTGIASAAGSARRMVFFAVS